MPNQHTGELDPMERIAIALERIADLLEQQQPDKAPNYTARMEDFKSFDWGKIGATVAEFSSLGLVFPFLYSSACSQ